LVLGPGCDLSAACSWTRLEVLGGLVEKTKHCVLDERERERSGGGMGVVLKWTGSRTGWGETKLVPAYLLG
jgi:hypothetical protein